MADKISGDSVAVRPIPEDAQSDSEAVQDKLKGSWWSRLWGTSDLDKQERKYVAKVDLYFFSYIMLGYFIKTLDQTNISNAFVSGMKEDLKLYGNERNYLNTYFNIGIIIGTVPSQMMQLKYVRPSVWIPSCELAWSILVMAMGGAKNVQTLYALRLFVGLLESCSFPGYAALLGSWYNQGQLGKRVAVFEQMGAISNMFSGYLQAALYTGLNGVGGLAGWQWLFIFDGIIGIPISIWGYWAIPDLPHNTKAFYFNKEEREYGVKRMDRIGRAAPRELTLKVVKRIYTSWHIWAFIFPYLMVANAAMGSQFFNLWLKAEKYSVVKVNTIPTAGSALQVIFALTFGTIADATGKRMHTANAASVFVIMINIMLAIWYIPKPALWFAFFCSYAGSAVQPVIITWGHEITQHDAELRQLLVATGNIFTYTFSAWLPIVLFPTYDAPHYKYAYQMLILFGGFSIIGTFVLNYLHKREL
ncbi:major facilitator superfamily domain-containing protein [Bisporella sp. PMI_857]|nr:major facilitator superfamily domain-containing protein [Bisporella sp. PMI_857]